MAAYRNAPDIACYQAWPSPLTPEAATDQARVYSEQDPESPGWFQYAIGLRADRSLAGDLGVNLHDNRLQADIGYTLAPALHGRGSGGIAGRADARRVASHCSTSAIRRRTCSSSSCRYVAIARSRGRSGGSRGVSLASSILGGPTCCSVCPAAVLCHRSLSACH